MSQGWLEGGLPKAAMAELGRDRTVVTHFSMPNTIEYYMCIQWRRLRNSQQLQKLRLRHEHRQQASLTNESGQPKSEVHDSRIVLCAITREQLTAPMYVLARFGSCRWSS